MPPIMRYCLRWANESSGCKLRIVSLDMQANSARSVRRLGVPAILAFLAVLCLAMPQLAGAAERSARVAQNAFERQGREDLAGALREAGEVRVIVGLQTAQELSQGVDGTPDQVKEQAVAARQTRLVERLARRKGAGGRRRGC